MRLDLDHGKVVHVSIIYHMANSWLNLFIGYDFYFWLRDSATSNTARGLRVLLVGFSSRQSVSGYRAKQIRYNVMWYPGRVKKAVDNYLA